MKTFNSEKYSKTHLLTPEVRLSMIYSGRRNISLGIKEIYEAVNTKGAHFTSDFGRRAESIEKVAASYAHDAAEFLKWELK